MSDAGTPEVSAEPAATAATAGDEIPAPRPGSAADGAADTDTGSASDAAGDAAETLDATEADEADIGDADAPDANSNDEDGDGELSGDADRADIALDPARAVARHFGLSEQDTLSLIIGEFEQVAFRKGLLVQASQAAAVLALAEAIRETALDSARAARAERPDRRLRRRDRADCVREAAGLARRLAADAVAKARDGAGDATDIVIQGRKVTHRSTDAVFDGLALRPNRKD
ncbi:MAG: hypothetical protein ACFBRM_13390 [Pikeienuella sp.]